MPLLFAPTELLYEIVLRIWETPLTPDERVQFMKSSRLVSKRWSAIYEDISSSDVHIPCESFYHCFFCKDGRDFAKCKRITFTVHDPQHQHSIGLSPARSLSYLGRADMARLTALNSMNIVYHNTTFPDPYMQGFFLALSRYIPTISISYTFSPEIPQSDIIYHRRHFERQSMRRYANPAVGTLEVNGADEYIAAIWESLFPERERMFRDGEEEKAPLMKVSSQFDLTYGLLVRLLDIKHQQEKSVQRREESSASIDLDRPTGVEHVDTDGISFVTTNSLSGALAVPKSLQKLVTLGDLGYIEKSTGLFETLFNAFEPQHVDGITIPSLFGYGDATIRNGRSQDTEVKRVEGGLTALSDVICKRLSGWKWRWSKKKNRFIERSTVEKWFFANTEKIVRIYGECRGVSKDDLIIVTGVVA